MPFIHCPVYPCGPAGGSRLQKAWPLFQGAFTPPCFSRLLRLSPQQPGPQPYTVENATGPRLIAPALLLWA